MGMAPASVRCPQGSLLSTLAYVSLTSSEAAEVGQEDFRLRRAPAVLRGGKAPSWTCSVWAQSPTVVTATVQLKGSQVLS